MTTTKKAARGTSIFSGLTPVLSILRLLRYASLQIIYVHTWTYSKNRQIIIFGYIETWTLAIESLKFSIIYVGIRPPLFVCVFVLPPNRKLLTSHPLTFSKILELRCRGVKMALSCTRKTRRRFFNIWCKLYFSNLVTFRTGNLNIRNAKLREKKK